MAILLHRLYCGIGTPPQKAEPEKAMEEEEVTQLKVPKVVHLLVIGATAVVLTMLPECSNESSTFSSAAKQEYFYGKRN